MSTCWTCAGNLHNASLYGSIVLVYARNCDPFSNRFHFNTVAHKAEYLVAHEAEVPDAEEAQEDGEVRVEGRAEEVPVHRTRAREELVHEGEAVREREGHQARRAAD